MEKIKTESLMPQGLNRLVLRSDDIKKVQSDFLLFKIFDKKEINLATYIKANGNCRMGDLKDSMQCRIAEDLVKNSSLLLIYVSKFKSQWPFE